MDAIENDLNPLPLEDVRVGGRIGELTAAITEARYAGERAKTRVCREAVDAFLKRVDDRRVEERGHWQGEFWGKWALGAVAACRYTGSSNLRGLIARMVRELLDTQDDSGYIGTYHNSRFGQVGEPVFEWNIWCRKYTLWGLVEAYGLLGEKHILDAACRFVDHLMSEVGPGAHDIRKTGWKFGLPSMSLLVPFVHLYRHTRDPRHLAYARYIVEQFSLLENEPPDILRKGLTGTPVPDWFPQPEAWAKTYEFLSCCEGMVELYRVTGDADLLTAARNIFAAVARTDRHITGTLSLSDHLVRSRFLVQAPMEVCDAVHWVRLAVELLSLSGEAHYADEIERTLYNCFLGAPGLDPFWGVRRQLLYGAHWVSPQHCGLKTHHCCVANLPRGLYQTMQVAVMEDGDGPVVQLYLPGRYRFPLSAGEGQLILETTYPQGEDIGQRFNLPEPREFLLRLRIPAWSQRSALTVDGANVPVDAENGYVTLRRTWSNDSRVMLHLDLRGRVEPLPHPGGMPPQPFSAVLRGPVVLARDIRLGDSTGIHDPVALQTSDAGHRLELTPVTPPSDIWLAYAVRVEGIRADEPAEIRLCDYSSAGNTWDVSSSDFRVWLPDAVVDPHTGA